jgi:type III pantothenate kinase
MLLTVDIGNTNITLGVFDKNEIIQSWRLATDDKRTEDEYGVFLKNLFAKVTILLKFAPQTTRYYD